MTTTATSSVVPAGPSRTKRTGSTRSIPARSQSAISTDPDVGTDRASLHRLVPAKWDGNFVFSIIFELLIDTVFAFRISVSFDFDKDKLQKRST